MIRHKSIHKKNTENLLYAEVAADGAHVGVRRLGRAQHLAPLENDVDTGPHHAHNRSGRLTKKKRGIMGHETNHNNNKSRGEHLGKS